MARRFIGRGAEYDDLYQAACLACVRALRVYQPERGVPFAAFAAQYAGGAIRNYLRDQAAAVHLPRTLYEQGAQLTRARRELTMQLMRGQMDEVKEVLQRQPGKVPVYMNFPDEGITLLAPRDWWCEDAEDMLATLMTTLPEKDMKVVDKR